MNKLTTPFLIVVLVGTSSPRAQSSEIKASAGASASTNGTPALALADPNQAWNHLSNLAKPAATTRISSRKEVVPEEFHAQVHQQQEQSWRAMEAARQFYTRFPDHPKATEAHKIEAIAAMHAIRGDDAAHEQFATTTATSFRDNKSLPTEDRVEVALALERYVLSTKIKAKAVKDEPSEWLRLGEDLEKEFGTSSVIQSYYLQLARRAEATLANQIATGVSRSPAASPEARAEARSIIARAGMVGKPLQLTLPRIRGGEFNLGQQQNKLTALVVWPAGDPESLASMTAFQGGLPEGVQVVYLPIGKVSVVLNAQGKLPVPGVICYAPTGSARKAMDEALNLRYAPAPCVYVLDRAGKVVGVGRLKELSALLAKAIE